MNFLTDTLEEYTREHTEEQPSLCAEIWQWTLLHRKDHRMLCGQVVGSFLKNLIRIQKARHILEVGTFTGYSTVWMSQSLPSDGTLTTIEKETGLSMISRNFIARLPNHSQITILNENAGTALGKLPVNHYDFVFLDADKAHYPKYFERIFFLLKPGGVLVADNCLWNGRVVRPENEDDFGIVLFNKMVKEHPDTDHVLLSVRDGLMLVIKRG